MNPAPSLSVIVPARNAEATLEFCLSSVRGSQDVDFELIVVDDGSTDRTAEIAARWADIVVPLRESIGPQRARRIGARRARATTWVFMDSDVMIQPTMLKSVLAILEGDPTIDAVTGRLSCNTNENGFFSQYKNLYMNFIFSKLPKKVTFLYGSFFALRRRSWRPVPLVTRGEDTALGQSLFLRGKNIVLHAEEELIHLKRYTCSSFFLNDFVVPRAWAQLFVRFQGWKQLGRHGTGYAHASKAQLCSVIIAPTILGLLACLPLYKTELLTFTTISTWVGLNAAMVSFMTKARGVRFGVIALAVTFLDNIVMALGIAAGLVREIRRKLPARAAFDDVHVSEPLY